MLKESESKESRGWKYKELTFDFEEYEQISMFEEEENENLYRKQSERTSELYTCYSLHN
jgi:hypothetical protein